MYSNTFHIYMLIVNITDDNHFITTEKEEKEYHYNNGFCNEDDKE